jgi:hypothetical protein
MEFLHCEGGVRHGSGGPNTGSSQIMTFGLFLYGLVLKVAALPVGHPFLVMDCSKMASGIQNVFRWFSSYVLGGFNCNFVLPYALLRHLSHWRGAEFYWPLVERGDLGWGGGGGCSSLTCTKSGLIRFVLLYYLNNSFKW